MLDFQNNVKETSRWRSLKNNAKHSIAPPRVAQLRSLYFIIKKCKLNRTHLRITQIYKSY
jgi:hypothetical protein